MSTAQTQPLDILLVEDSLTDQKLFSLALKGLPATLHSVGDGEKALQFLQTHMPQVMILDLNIPVKDGFEVITEIKSNPTQKKLPIVVLSTSSNHKDIAKCYLLGANAFITKPLDLDKYLETVKRTVEYWGSICTVSDINQ